MKIIKNKQTKVTRAKQSFIKNCFSINKKTPIRQKIIVTFLCATIISTCSLSFICNRKYDSPNFDTNPFFSVAHAGGALKDENGNYDEYLNCKEGFEQYYVKGTRMFEFDLVFSSDGKLVGTHKFEYHPNYSFDNRISYNEYNSKKILGKYTGMTEDILLKLISDYPDCKFIIDTKEREEMTVYDRISKVAEQKMLI